MAKPNKPPKVDAPHIDEKVAKTEEVEETKEVEEKKEVSKAPEIEVEKVDKIASNLVKVKVVKDIPNLFIINKRYAHRKGETATIDAHHAERLRNGGYIQ